MKKVMDNAKAQTKESQSAISPDTVVKILQRGNARFATNVRLNRNFVQQAQDTADGQFPFAAIVSCIDSRVPAEIIFDQGIGDVFNVRIAGNFINKDILGSLEFACKVAGSKVIVVLGHSSCGAIKGACSNVELGHLTSMLDKLKPAVEEVRAKSDRESDDPQFVQQVAVANVKRTVSLIIEQSEVLGEMYEKDEIDIVGAMYNIETRLVEFIDL